MSENYSASTRGTYPSGASGVKSSATPSFEDFRDWLVDHLERSTDTSVIDVVPAQCGLGKSRFVTIQIAEALQQRREGVLVITDEVERLNNYVSSTGTDSYLRDYINRNTDRILVLTASNIRERMKDLYRAQVVCLTTQRFFGMERDDVLAIVNSHKPKRFVFVDERAPLSETIEVSLKVLNDVDTILTTKLDNTCDQHDKNFLVTQWRFLRARFDRIFHEQSHTDDKLVTWYEDNDPHATTDDERFLRLVTSTYARQLRRGDNDVLKKIKATFQIIHEGGLLISSRKPNARSHEEYSNFFLIDLDHADLLRDIGGKAIILDATGGCDPVYRRYYVNQIDASKFNRRLDRLTLNLINVNTSKVSMTRGKPYENAKIRAIKDYIHLTSTQPIDCVFSYKAIEEEFADIAQHTGHFGSLKGKNCFRNCTNVFQVGLNRESDERYLCRAIHSEKLKYPPDRRFYSVFNRATAARQTMLLSLLADTEQNIFRSAIRNADDDRQITYTIFFRCKEEPDKTGHDQNELSQLTTMLRERFEALGATVNVIDTPRTILELKTRERKASGGKKTAAQRVTEWLDGGHDGEWFKISTMLKECDLNNRQYQDMLKRNPHIKQRLEEMKTDRKGYYQFHSPTHGCLTA